MPKPSPPAPRPLAWLSAVLLIPLLAGCRDGFPTLSLPVAPWAGYAYFPLAQQQGFDRAASLHLQTVPARNGQLWIRHGIKVFQRRAREIPVVMWVVTLAFVVYFASEPISGWIGQ